MNNFYVYKHIHPKTKETVYIGKGCHGRAWDVTRARGPHKKHQSWMKELTSLGYIPTDWVFIYARNLTEIKALKIEKSLLHQGCTRFNRQAGENNNKAKLTNVQAIEVYEMAKQGVYHKIIADKYGISRTGVSMISTRKQWKQCITGYLNEKNRQTEIN